MKPKSALSARAPRAVIIAKPNKEVRGDKLGGHLHHADQNNPAASDGGHLACETHHGSASVAPIIELYRHRVDMHRAEKRLTLQIKAICRRILQGSGMERADATKESAALYKSVMNGGKHARAAETLINVMPLLEARRPLEQNRKAIEKSLTLFAKQLPVWPWIENVRGVSSLSLAALVGEAGDPGNYATVSKLWKRMGLAVIGGCAQGKPGKGAVKEDWIEHGYNAARRSVMWNIGACLIKAKNPEYTKLYRERKAADAIKNPTLTKGHIHARAQRYIEKRFLRELWKAWRAAQLGMAPGLVVPSAIAPQEMVSAAA